MAIKRQLYLAVRLSCKQLWCQTPTFIIFPFHVVQAKRFQPNLPTLPQHFVEHDVCSAISFAVVLGVNFWRNWKIVVAKPTRIEGEQLLSLDRAITRSILRFFMAHEGCKSACVFAS